MNLENLKYPIGRHQIPEIYSAEIIEDFIQTLERFPTDIRTAVAGLTNEQLDTPYRPDGWTIRQVVHHCADSHMNSIIRFKLALTEDKPTIKPYFEEHWAELADSKNYPLESSLSILEGVHARLTTLLRSLQMEQMKRKFIHPDRENEMSVLDNLSLYAWHARHHLGHIIGLKERMGW
jgi:DinB superfamily